MKQNLFIFIKHLFLPELTNWKMLKSNLLYCALLIASFFSLNANSQTVVNATGSTVTNSDFAFEYSIGEVVITTISTSDNAVTQGLLQPNLKVVNPSCDIINSTMLSFENPTADKVRLVGRYDWITDYRIYAADGKLVRIAKFQNNFINIASLPAAVYFLQLYPGCNGNYRTFKIVKQ